MVNSRNILLKLQYIILAVLGISCILLCQYMSALAVIFLFFIPIYFIEKNKVLPMVARVAYGIFVLCVIMYIYEVIFLPITTNGENQQYLLTTGRIIVAWSYFAIISYIIFVFIKYNKISLPVCLFSNKSLLFLTFIGGLYFFYIFFNIPASYFKAHHLYTITDKLMYYKHIFITTFLITGIINLLLRNVLDAAFYRKILISYILLIYIIGFLASGMLIMLGFGGLGTIMQIFPLNIITAILTSLSIKFSVLVAFSSSMWGIIIILLSEANKTIRQMGAIMFYAILLFLPYLLSKIEVGYIPYPFDRMIFIN